MAGTINQRRKALLQHARQLLHGRHHQQQQSPEQGLSDDGVIPDDTAALTDRLLADFLEEALHTPLH